MVRNLKKNSTEYSLPPTSPSSLDRTGFTTPTREARPGAPMKAVVAGSMRRTRGKRRSPGVREKRLVNLLTYQRRLVKEKELLPSHLMLQHDQDRSVRRRLGQEFDQNMSDQNMSPEVSKSGHLEWSRGFQAGTGGWSRGSQAESGGWSRGSQSGPKGWSRGSQAGPGGWSIGSQAGPGGWSTGSQAGPGGWSTASQAGPGGWVIGSQTGPAGWVTGSQAGPTIGAVEAENPGQKTNSPGQ